MLCINESWSLRINESNRIQPRFYLAFIIVPNDWSTKQQKSGFMEIYTKSRMGTMKAFAKMKCIDKVTKQRSTFTNCSGQHASQVTTAREASLAFAMNLLKV
jgi:hypothetical protein